MHYLKSTLVCFMLYPNPSLEELIYYSESLNNYLNKPEEEMLTWIASDFSGNFMWVKDESITVPPCGYSHDWITLTNTLVHQKCTNLFCTISIGIKVLLNKRKQKIRACLVRYQSRCVRGKFLPLGIGCFLILCSHYCKI